MPRLTMLRTRAARGGWHVKRLVMGVVLVEALLTYYYVESLKCSSSKSTQLIQELCLSYDRGLIVGNMCGDLCSSDRFLFSYCGNDKGGKNVLILQCTDCGRGATPSKVVLKTLPDLNLWMQDSARFFERFNTTQGMVIQTKKTLFRFFRTEFETDLTKQSDVLSYVWGQSSSDFVNNRRTRGNHAYNRTKAALQSILGLATQHEYSNMILRQKDVYIPKLYGTCGPAYFVEYTPSLSYLGYILYQGKLPEVLSLKPKMISWSARVKAALQILKLLEHLESLMPPLYMCDIRPHNFGLNEWGHVTILDSDSLRYGKLIHDDHRCDSDNACSFITCKGKCNLTSGKCTGPTNTHLQTVCRYILISDYTALGLLRWPPSHVSEELQQLLNECVFPRQPDKVEGMSDKQLLHSLVSLLHKSLTR